MQEQKPADIKSKWTLEEGLTLVRLIEPIAVLHGYHTALAGGVLHRGTSDKDVDIVFYERTKDKKSSKPWLVFEALKKNGFGPTFHKCSHGASAADIGMYKQVFVGTFFGKRVDLFFLRNAAGDPAVTEC